MRKAAVRFKEEACTALATRARVPCGNVCSATAGSFARRGDFSAPWKSVRSSGSSSAVTRITALRGSTDGRFVALPRVPRVTGRSAHGRSGDTRTSTYRRGRQCGEVTGTSGIPDASCPGGLMMRCCVAMRAGPDDKIPGQTLHGAMANGVPTGPRDGSQQETCR